MLRASQCRTLGKRTDPSHRLLAGLQEHICKGEIVVREGQLSLLERCYGRNKGVSEVP